MNKRFKKIRGREVPIIEPITPFFPIPQESSPVIAVCGECNLELRQVMGYVCGNQRCPTGLGGARC